MRILIAAGGEAPAKREFMRYARGAGVIAADSGADWLFRFGYTPDLLVGDFDSANPEVLLAYREKGVPVLSVPAEKDDTDAMLAARYAVEQRAEEVILFGGTGGRLDHTLANFHVLAYLLKKGVRAKMLGKSAEIFLVTGGFTFTGKVGETVSLFPFMGDAVVTLKNGGLYYPLDKLVLTDTFTGVSNRLVKPTVELETEGKLLIIRSRQKK